MKLRRSYKARYYDPALGRFITADSVIPGAKNTQTFNRYMYVGGNPLKYRDPTGHWPGAVIGAIVGAVVGGVVGGTHGNPTKLKNWKHFDWKAAGKGAVVGAAIGATIGANPALAGYAALSGGINAYFNCRDGATFQDVFVSFSIGYAVGYAAGYYFPITTKTPVVDSLIIGACR